jgi:hypothetical protein
LRGAYGALQDEVAADGSLRRVYVEGPALVDKFARLLGYSGVGFLRGFRLEQARPSVTFREKL